MGMPYYIAYCASKAGMVGMTRAMAVALAPTVTVNVICPGPIDTPMLQAHFETSPDARADLMRRVPMGRAASREEIAAGSCTSRPTGRARPARPSRWTAGRPPASRTVDERPAGCPPRLRLRDANIQRHSLGLRNSLHRDAAKGWINAARADP